MRSSFSRDSNSVRGVAWRLCYVRDQRDNLGFGEGAYNDLIARIVAFREN